MRRALGDAGTEDRDRHTLRRKEPFDWRALRSKRNGEHGDQWRDADLTPDHGIDHRRLTWKQRRLERRLFCPVALAQRLVFEHGPGKGAAAGRHDGLPEALLAEF